jgi:hypothetical protein
LLPVSCISDPNAKPAVKEAPTTVDTNWVGVFSPTIGGEYKEQLRKERENFDLVRQAIQQIGDIPYISMQFIE